MGAIVCSIAPLPTLEPVQALSFTRTITFNETGSPGFPTTTTIAPTGGSGSNNYDVINNSTGALGVDGTPDITVSATASARGTAGTSGSPNVEWNSTSTGRFTSERGFTVAVSANNPGTLQSTTTKLLFDSSLNVTNLAANFLSLNTAGILWEYSVLGFLDPSGNPFSTAPVIGAYNSAASFTGSPSTGWYVAANKGTVTGVGGNQSAAGTSGPADNVLLTYALAGLTSGTQVGGLSWTTYMEDTRGTSNGSSNFTASLTDVTFTNTAVAPIPTPALLPGLVGMGLSLWRKRNQQDAV